MRVSSWSVSFLIKWSPFIVLSGCGFSLVISFSCSIIRLIFAVTWWSHHFQHISWACLRVTQWRFYTFSFNWRFVSWRTWVNGFAFAVIVRVTWITLFFVIKGRWFWLSFIVKSWTSFGIVRLVRVCVMRLWSWFRTAWWFGGIHLWICWLSEVIAPIGVWDFSNVIILVLTEKFPLLTD